MSRVSIDKCRGDKCICHEAKKPWGDVRVLNDVKIESISIDNGPSIFPGGGAIQIINTPFYMGGPTQQRIAQEIARERVRRQQEAYMEEARLSASIVRKNRHSVKDGHWYGPEPEPRKAGPNCECVGCLVFYA